MSKKIDLGHVNSFDNNSINKSSSLKKETKQVTVKNYQKTFNEVDSKDSRSSDMPRTTISINMDRFSKDTLKTGNEINPNSTKKKEKKKRSKKKKLILTIILFIIIAGLAFGATRVYFAFNDLNKSGVNVSLGDLIGGVISKKEDPQLLKDGNLTNVLLVGVDTRAGTSSGGLENTDSIMIASYNNTTGKVALISIPRDNYVPFYAGKNNTLTEKNRINAAYAIAQENNYPGGGLALLRATLTQMTGLQIQYTAQINFMAFKQVIDKLGGITVDVENSFTDYEYPNDTDTGLITVSFKKGLTEMNGTKALQYARSRHSVDNGEGSDFSRAKRQQKVIIAIQDKIKKTNFITDPNSFFDFINIFGNNVKIEKTVNSTATATKVDINDISAVIAMKDKVDSKNIPSVVLDPSIGGCNAIIKKLDGYEAYYIGPVLGVGKFDDVKKYVNFAITNPALYLENKTNCADSSGSKIGLVDNGLSYTSTLAEITKLSKEFINSEYMATLKAPINDIDGVTPLTGVSIYDVDQLKPETKAYLVKKYNAAILTEAQVPANIKALTKGYDLIVFFPKASVK